MKAHVFGERTTMLLNLLGSALAVVAGILALAAALRANPRPCPQWRGGRARALVVASATAVLFGLAPSAASAAVVWRVDPLASTTAPAGGSIDYRVQLTNTGDSDADAGAVPVTFSGALPRGLSISSVAPVVSPLGWDCSSVTAGDSSFSCTATGGTLMTHDRVTFDVAIAVAAEATGVLTTSFTVAGGDPSTGDPASPSATAVDPTTIASGPPPFGIDAFDGAVIADASGTPFTQAGGHPYAITTSIDFNTFTSPAPYKGMAWPAAAPRDVLVDLPPGLIGNPTGLAKCTLEQLVHNQSIAIEPLCPPASQVGVTVIRTVIGNFTAPGSGTILGPLPVFNMVPPPGLPARFAFNASGVIVMLDARLRSEGDYGLSVDVHSIPEGLAIAGTSLTFWGVPADPSHDLERSCAGAVSPPAPGDRGCQSGAPLTAFLRNPTSCTAPGVGLQTTLRTDSWSDPGDFRTATFVSHLLPGYPFPRSEWGPPVGTTGCDRVPFAPRIDVRPRSTTAGAPSEFDVDLSLPQNDDPTAVGEADLRTAEVTLPLGVRINPSSASGLQGCSPDQIRLHDASSPSCPDASKIGSVTIDTPLLDRPLTGGIYLAAPHVNPFGTLLSLYVVGEGSGVVVKLAGRVDADPLTGQLTTTFDDNPQTPFSDLRLALKGGARAALLNPPACGTYTTHAKLTGWNDAVVSRESSFTLSHDGNGAPCPAPQFSPGFSAGTEIPTAGRSSPLHVQFTRDDADQELKAVTVHMPPGLTAKIANATLCAERDAGAGTCPEVSRIGNVTVGAGAGPNPFYITNGRAYITGPYKGAPFGLSMVVPAVAGPFDLGNVVVRSAIFIDKHDASVRVVSDPLPMILQGIPLDVRDVRVSANKPNFFLNPTSCARKTVTGEVDSTAGARAHVSSPFQVGECANLGFKPRMALSVGGVGHTHTGQPTPLTTRIAMPRGDANLRYVRVTLPKTINARLTVINDACTRQQFESEIAKCAHARAGTATAVTPLLRDPLRGNVYFVKNGHPLPDLFIALRGQVAFDLIGRITIVNSTLLRTTFNAAPDVPIRSFTLRLFGDSRHGSVGAAANLCSASARRQTAQLDYIGQNGKVSQVARRLAVHGCPRHPARRHAARRGARR